MTVRQVKRSTPTQEAPPSPPPTPLQSLLLRLLLLLPPVLRYPERPVRQQRRKDIEHNKRPHDAKVPPPQIVVAVHLRQERVRAADGAEAAVRRRGRVLQVAAGGVDVGGHVGLAGLAGRGLEVQVLDGGADDVGVGDGGRKHAADEVGEGRDSVHEDPEAREHGRAGEHAAEDEAEREDQVGDVSARLGRLDAGDDHVGEGTGEEQELEDEEEHQPAALVHGVGGFRVAVQADGVVPADEDEEGGERVPREFDDDVGEHEGSPGVSLRGAFADLVEGALGDEVGHDLLGELAEDSHEHEDGEELVLHALLTILRTKE